VNVGVRKGRIIMFMESVNYSIINLVNVGVRKGRIIMFMESVNLVGQVELQ
jgi:hypothetical protein